MSKKYIEKTFLKFNLGEGKKRAHVDAVHAKGPKADLYTGELVEKIVHSTGCAGIIAKVSRTVVDLNRTPYDEKSEMAIKEYRGSIEHIVQHLNIFERQSYCINKPYLHLALHGMKDVHYGPYAIEIGTRFDASCSPEITDWFKQKLHAKIKAYFPKIKCIFNERFPGDFSKQYHRLGDNYTYNGYGENYHTIQIEISKTLREHHSDILTKIFSEIILEFEEFRGGGYS